MQENLSNIKAVIAINRGAKVAAENGATIDLLGFQGVSFVLTTDTLTTGDASNFLALGLQESDDGSSWSATITDANRLLGTMPVVDKVTVVANTAYHFGMTRPAKRYIRVVSALTGTVSLGFSVTALLSFPRHAPVNLGLL